MILSAFGNPFLERNNSLSGSIPSDLADLTALETLALNNNTLSSTIPSQLGQLTNLKFLYLNNNNLTGAIPPELGDMDALEVLNLSTNSLSGPITTELQMLINLHTLHLDDNPELCVPTSLVRWWNTFRGGQDVARCVLSRDRAALEALYIATDGDNWTNANNWMSNKPLNRWYGVTVEGDRVVELDLQNNNLYGTLPEELGDLSRLEELELDLNQIFGEIPSELAGMRRLVYLSLRQNQLSGSIPADLDDLRYLITANLSSNPQLTGPVRVAWSYSPSPGRDSPATVVADDTDLCLPDQDDAPNWWAQFGTPTNLETCGARPTSQPQPVIRSERNALMALYNSTDGDRGRWDDDDNWGSNLPLGEWFGVSTDPSGNVIALDLEDNDLDGTIPMDLASLILLQRLNLADNDLTGSIPSQLGNLSNLDSLSLHDNSLDGEVPEQLGDLTALRTLRLNGNSLTGRIPTSLEEGLTSLRHLALWGNPGLCAPIEIKRWLDDLRNSSISICGGGLRNLLAYRFAPVLRMHRDEIVLPRAVDVMIDNADLRDGSGNAAILPPGQAKWTAQDLGKLENPSDSHYYLDFEEEPPYWIDEQTFSIGPEPFSSYATAAADLPQGSYPHVVYADLSLGTDRMWLFFWLFYPLDRNHEGDWELVILEFETLGEQDVDTLINRILIDGIEPRIVGYSAHGGFNAECWIGNENVARRRDLHPEVYAARGSHANYFAPDEYPIVGFAPHFNDETNAFGTILVPSNYEGLNYTRLTETYEVLFLNADTMPWLKFYGKWGEQVGLARPHGSGPPGPVVQTDGLFGNFLDEADDSGNCASANSVSTTSNFQRKIGKRSVTVDKDPEVPSQTRVEFSWPAFDKIATGEGDLEIDFSSIALTSDSPDIETLIVIARESGNEILEVIDITLSESLKRREATVCIPPPAGFVGDFQILHFDDDEGEWAPLETYIDEQDGSICALTTSFSLFAVVGDRDLGFAGSHVSPSRYASHIEPNITSVTLSPSDTVRLSTDIYGQQNILDNSLAENLTFQWDLDGTSLEGDGHEIEFNAPSSPGQYSLIASLSDAYCNGKHGTCSAEITIRVRRPRSADVAVNVSEPVNPPGQIPIAIPAGDGAQHAVFTPVEGGEVTSESCAFVASSGAINDNEYVGIAIQTITEPGQLTPIDDPRFATDDVQCKLSAVDNTGTTIADYRLRVAGDICLPMPDAYRSKPFDARLLAVNRDGQTQILSTSVRINDPKIPLKLCGKLSTLPNVVVAALPAGVAAAIPTPDPSADAEDIAAPDTGSYNIPFHAVLLILFLSAAMITIVSFATIKTKTSAVRGAKGNGEPLAPARHMSPDGTELGFFQADRH